MGDRYASRELRAGDIEAIERLIADGPRAQTLLLPPLLRATRAGDSEVWWYGTLREGTELRAVMGVRGHSAVVYAASEAAAEAMGRDALAAQRDGVPTGTHRHQLLGDQGTMERFWSIFKGLGRQVVVDRPRPLFAALDGLVSPSKRATVRLATAADAKIVNEFGAEHVLEASGYDPRRLAREAHERRGAAATGAGRQVVAFEGPKPVLTAEITLLDDVTVLLERVYVPRPMRAMKRLVGGALVGATKLGPAEGREVLFFAELEGLAEAAEKAGFERRATYHTVVMLG